MKLRPYQDAAIDGARQKLKECRSVVVQMPTGTGKSLVFRRITSGVVERGKRVLLLVQGINLVRQAARHLRSLGVSVGVEMAENKVGKHLNSRGLIDDAPQIVVASRDSLALRLEQYPRDFFKMIIIDECHHVLSEQYIRILEHFGASVPLKHGGKSPWLYETKVVGLTATPDRGDHGDIMQVFEDVGFKYTILEAIDDGWLVPVEQELCHLPGLDLSKVRRVAGDLSARQLEAELKPLMLKICREIIEVADGRPTLIYNPLKTMAEATSAQLRELAKGRRIETIVAETEEWGSRSEGTLLTSRDELFAAMGRGEVWALSSVGTLTEGVDIPCATVGAMLRLTTSRPLYAQIMGRILRPAEEIAHELNDCASAAERKAMIATSSKPKATMLDFAGNAGKHKLVHVIDVLTEGEDDKLVNLARGKVEREGMKDPFKALEYARDELARMISEAKGKEIERILVDPFALYDVTKRRDSFGRPATEAQLEALLNFGVIDFRRNDAASRDRAREKLRKQVDLVGAHLMLDEAKKRIDRGLSSMKQIRKLVQAGIAPAAARGMSFATAKEAMSELEAAEWRATPAWISKYNAAARPQEASAA